MFLIQVRETQKMGCQRAGEVAWCSGRRILKFSALCLGTGARYKSRAFKANGVLTLSILIKTTLSHNLVPASPDVVGHGLWVSEDDVAADWRRPSLPARPCGLLRRRRL